MEHLYAWLASLAHRGLLPESFEYPFITRGLFAVLLVGPLLGGLSHLVVMRRLAFFSAALGQAALTGLSLGLLVGEPLGSSLGGVTGFCLLSALGMVYVKRRSRLPPDTLIGVFMALTLGLGICLLVAVTRRFNIHQVEAVMFGSLLTVTDGDLLLLLVAGVGIAVAIGWRYNALVADSLSRDLARADGADTAFTEYLFVLLLALAITVSLKIIGAFLVEALVVVPAAAARNLAISMRGYLAWSIAIAVAAGLAGLAVSASFQVPTGGAIVLALALLFFATLVAGALLGRSRGR